MTRSLFLFSNLPEDHNILVIAYSERVEGKYYFFGVKFKAL
tara:strand:- start:182 stop:304 length:123 start_codon:yes stop_codon:yes gene_type:complete